MVWEARLKGTRGFQKLVAIKTMLPAMIDEPSFERMFLDEASLASQVRHPHVVETLDLGEQDRILYLVMEWVDGEPLNVIMHYAAKRGGIPQAIAVAIMLQALRGLHAAHELRDDSGALVGLVHRDVTPQNVLVSYEGVVKLVDFGVAKATSRLSAETEAGQLKGKIAYMSPEQLKGEPIDRRTDIFALGILLYMLTTGVHPFKGDEQAETVQNITSAALAKLPHRLVHGYNPALEVVVMQAIAKDPAKRFASANDMFKALRGVVQAATDDEVADFIKGLMADRLERRRNAIRAALEIADTQKSDPRQARPSVAAEDIDSTKTVVEPRLGAFGPGISADLTFGAHRADVDLSLSGVAPSRGSTSDGGAFGSRRALATMMTVAVLVAAAGVGLFVMTRTNEPADPLGVAAQTPAPTAPATVDAPDMQAVEKPGATRGQGQSSPGPLPTAAASAERIVTVAKRRSTKKRPASPQPDSSAPISPIRDPGF
jgi:serine/threonine-protein kinase